MWEQVEVARVISGLTLAALCVVGQSAPLPAPSQALSKEAQEEQVRAWKVALRAVGKVEGVTIAFDVNVNAPAPLGYERKLGAAGLEFLGLCTNRAYKVQKGVHLFVREIVPARKVYANAVAEFSDFVSTLPKADAQRLAGEGLPVSNLSPDQRAYLGKVLGYPTGGPGNALAKWDRTVMALSVLPGLEYKDPKSGVVKRITLSRGPSSPDRIERRKSALSGATDLDIRPAEARTTGEFKLPEGDMMTLEELVAKAQKALGVRFSYDKRLASSYVFAAGQWDLEAFQATLIQLTKTSAAIVQPYDERDAGELLRELLAGPLAGMNTQELDGYGPLGASASDFLNGKDMNLSDLCQGNPGLRDWLSARGVPLDANVKLTGAFGLEVLTLGTRPIIEVKNGQRTLKQLDAWLGTVPLHIGP